MAVNDETAVRKYKEQHLSHKKVEFDMFYRDCINFLTASENISELRKYTAQLLKCMPMRMARAKFFDIDVYKRQDRKSTYGRQQKSRKKLL